MDAAHKTTFIIVESGFPLLPEGILPPGIFSILPPKNGVATQLLHYAVRADLLAKGVKIEKSVWTGFLNSCLLSFEVDAALPAMEIIRETLNANDLARGFSIHWLCNSEACFRAYHLAQNADPKKPFGLEYIANRGREINADFLPSWNYFKPLAPLFPKTPKRKRPSEGDDENKTE